MTLTGCTPPGTFGEPGSAAPAEHVVVGPLDGRTGAFFSVRDAASRVRIVLGTLPGLLYRITTPADSGFAPGVTGGNGRIEAVLRPTGADGPDEVRVVLNRAVRWDIRLPAGAGEQQLDLAAGRVSRVDLGASGLVELRLPDPEGTVPVTFMGAAGDVAMLAGTAAPLRIGLVGGADTVVTPWAVDDRVAAGAWFEAPGWRTARDRYAVLARGELGSLSLHRFSPAAR